MTRCQVLAASIFFFALSADAYQFGPEFSVNAPAYTLSEIATSVNVASNGTQFLLVWTTRYGGVFASRVTTDGALLEPVGIPLNEDTTGFAELSVASAGGDYLVAWSDNGKLLTRIIESDGTLAPAQQLPIGDRICGLRELSSTGDSYVLTASCGDVRAFILNSRGQFLHEFTLRPDPTIVPIAVGADRSGFLFVEWLKANEERTLYQPVAQKYDLNGTSRNPVTLSLTTGSEPVVTANGSEYLIAWATTNGVRTARFSIEGDLLSENIVLSEAPALSVRLTPDGDDFVLIVLEAGLPMTVRALTVRDDNVLAEAVLSSVTTWREPSVTSGGGRHFVAAIRDVSPVTSGGAPFNASIGWILNAETLSIERVIPAGMAAADHGEFPAAASNSESLLVAWEEFDPNSGRPVIRTNILGPLSGPRTTEGIVPSDFPGPQRNPAVGSDGTNYLVVWEEAGAIVGRAVSRSGETSSNRFFIADDGRKPTLAYDGANFLVVWSIGRGIRAARVTPSGLVLDRPAITIDEDNHAHYSPDVAWNGRSFMIVWNKRFMPFGPIPGPELLAGAFLEPNTGAVSSLGLVISNELERSITSVSQASLECGPDTCLIVASRGESLVVAGVPLHPTTGRARAVRRDRPYLVYVVAETGFWPGGVRSLVADQSGFFLVAQRNDNTVVAIDFTRTGNRLSAVPIDLQPGEVFTRGGSLVRVGERLAYVFSRITKDRSYGGARRSFVRFSEAN